jgi:hypothetical protein
MVKNPPEIVYYEEDMTPVPTPLVRVKEKGDEKMADKPSGGGGMGATVMSALKTPLGIAATAVVVLYTISAGSNIVPYAFHNLMCNTFSAEISCIQREAIKARTEAQARASLLSINPMPDSNLGLRGPANTGPGFTVGGELNRRMHGGQPPPQRRTMQVHGVDRSPPPCAGQLRREEASGAWVCRVYH